MSSQITHPGFGFNARGAAPLQVARPALWTEPRPTASAASHWLERLAAWAEKQPVHHRLGSYTALR